MKTILQKPWIIIIALVLAVILTAAVVPQRQVDASCQSGVSWRILNRLDNRQKSDPREISSRSEATTEDGQDITDLQTNYVNPDGTSHLHEETHYIDSKGNRCDGNREPYKADHSHDEDKEINGNRTEHTVDIIEANGKCMKTVHDREWDSQGNLTIDSQYTTEILCSQYNLRVSFYTTHTDAYKTMTYGPNTVTVCLENKGNTYRGKFESVFDGKLKGDCQGNVTWPVALDVTGTRDKESGDLVFMVNTTLREPWTLGSCPGMQSTPPLDTFAVLPHTFRLPVEDRASVVLPEGPVTWVYTLVRK
jgi:hypothetical protein